MSIYTVKLNTSPWELTQEEFNYYTPNNDGYIENFKFEVNNNCNVCDYWIVRGNIQKKFEIVKCPKENIIFLLDEMYEERIVNKNFLSQFAMVISPKTLPHSNVYLTHESVPWLFHKIPFSQLMNQSLSECKTKEICLMTSDVTWLEGHKKRFAFTNILIGHFKERLDVYGRGFKNFDCKYDILKNYKYCIAIENTSVANYFTEKINECFLSETFPIYYGCPNITEYYDKDSLLQIDIDNYKESIELIEQALKNNLFEEQKQLVKEQKLKYLTNYHLPLFLVKKIKNQIEKTSRKRPHLILNEKFFIYPIRLGIMQIFNGCLIVFSRLLRILLFK